MTNVEKLKCVTIRHLGLWHSLDICSFDIRHFSLGVTERSFRSLHRRRPAGTNGERNPSPCDGR